MIFLCLVVIVGQFDKSVRTYSLRATDEMLANICRTPRNGENSFDMSVSFSLSKGHSAAGASKSEGILFDNLLSDKAEAMLSRLQVCLMFVNVSDGRCSVWTGGSHKDHWAFLRIRKVQMLRLKLTISVRIAR